MKVKDPEKLDRIIARVGELPAVPKVVTQVLRLTDDPATTMAQMSETIQNDPALAAKILQVSNSPYYGLRGQVGTLKLALVVLGIREVKNIVLAVSIFETFRGPGTEALLASNFWTHSITVAGLAKMLGARLRLGLQGEEFISGLLHDVGKMILWYQLGKGYARVYDKATAASDVLFEAEDAAFGFTHADVGAALLARWDLPRQISDALWHHHEEDGRHLSDAAHPQLAAVVRIANLAFHDELAKHHDGPSRACEDEKAWGELASAPVPIPIPREARREVLTRFATELAQAPPLAF